MNRTLNNVIAMLVTILFVMGVVAIALLFAPRCTPDTTATRVGNVVVGGCERPRR